MLEIHIGNILTNIVGEIPGYVKIAIKEQSSYSIQGAEFSIYGATTYCPVCKKNTEVLTWDEKRTCPQDGFSYRKCFQHGLVRPVSLWDGRKYLFDNKDACFPTGIINRILLVLKQANIPYKVMDERIAPYTRRMAWHGPTLRYYQKEAVRSLIGKSRGIVHAATGCGKCFGKNTLILMYDNTVKPVQEIVPGDLVMGMDQEPRTVVEVHTGIAPLYRVSYMNGTQYCVTENHVLTGKLTRKAQINNPSSMTITQGAGQDLDIVDIPVCDYIKESDAFKRAFHGFSIKENKQELSQIALVRKAPGTYYGFSVKEDEKHFLLADGTVVHNSNILAAMTAEIGVNTLVLTHTAAVFHQLYNTFKNTLKIPIGRIGDGLYDPKKITIAMPQSLVESVRVPKKKLVNGRWCSGYKNVQIVKEKYQDFLLNTEAFFVDECHRIASDTVQLVSNACVNAFFRIGVSATPYRADLLDILIESTTGKINYKYTATQAIADGFLSTPTIHMVAFKQAPYPRKKVAEVLDKKTKQVVAKEVPVTYADLYTDRIVRNAQRNLIIANIAYKHYQLGESTLIIVRMIEHGELIYNKLKYLGKSVRWVNGEDHADELKAVLQEMNTGDCKICIATGIFNEGIDVTGLNVCINTTACDSPVTAIQILGRTLRRTDTKNTVDFYDISDYGVRWLGTHTENRKAMYLTEPAFKLVNEQSENYLTD